MTTTQPSIETRVHLMRADRRDQRHELADWTAAVLVTAAEAPQLPTSNALQQAITSLAQRSESESLEAFAQELTTDLLADAGTLGRVEVDLESHLWKRLVIEDRPSPTAFMKGSDERQFTHVSRPQAGPLSIRSGFAKMSVLKALSSARAGSLTASTAVEAGASIGLLRTTISANWLYKEQAPFPALDFNKLRSRIRERCIATFARQDSEDLQQILQIMTEAALNETDVVSEITLRMESTDLLACALAEANETGRERHVVLPSEASQALLQTTVRRM